MSFSGTCKHLIQVRNTPLKLLDTGVRKEIDGLAMETPQIVRKYLEQSNVFIHEYPRLDDGIESAFSKLQEREAVEALVAELEATHCFERLEAARLLLFIGVGLPEQTKAISVILDVLCGDDRQEHSMAATSLLLYATIPEDLASGIERFLAASDPNQRAPWVCIGSRTEALKLRCLHDMGSLLKTPERLACPESVAAEVLRNTFDGEALQIIVQSATSVANKAGILAWVTPEYPANSTLEGWASEIIIDFREPPQHRLPAIQALLHVATRKGEAQQLILNVVETGDSQLLAAAVEVLCTYANACQSECVDLLLNHLSSEQIELRESAALCFEHFIDSLDSTQAESLSAIILEERDIEVLQLQLRAVRSLGEPVAAPLMKNIDLPNADMRTMMILSYLLSLGSPTRSELYVLLDTDRIHEDTPDFIKGLASGIIGAFETEFADAKIALSDGLQSHDESTVFKALAVLLSSPNDAIELIPHILPIFLGLDTINSGLARAVLWRIGPQTLPHLNVESKLTDAQNQAVQKLREELQTIGRAVHEHALSWLDAKLLKQFVFFADCIVSQKGGVSFNRAPDVLENIKSEQEREGIALSTSSIRTGIQELEAKLSSRWGVKVTLTRKNGNTQQLTKEGRELHAQAQEYLGQLHETD